MSVKIMNENGNVEHEFSIFPNDIDTCTLYKYIQTASSRTWYFSQLELQLLDGLKYVNVNIAIRWRVALFDRLSAKMASKCGEMESALVGSYSNTLTAAQTTQLDQVPISIHTYCKLIENTITYNSISFLSLFVFCAVPLLSTSPSPCSLHVMYTLSKSMFLYFSMA